MCTFVFATKTCLLFNFCARASDHQMIRCSDDQMIRYLLPLNLALVFICKSSHAGVNACIRSCIRQCEIPSLYVQVYVGVANHAWLPPQYVTHVYMYVGTWSMDSWSVTGKSRAASVVWMNSVMSCTLLHKRVCVICVHSPFLHISACRKHTIFQVWFLDMQIKSERALFLYAILCIQCNTT